MPLRSVAARCPKLEAGRGSAQTGRIVAWSLAAAVSIVLVTVYGIPLLADRLAPLVPFAVEKRIGEAVDRQARAIFGGQNCTRPEGQAAFDKMMAKLKDAGGFDAPLRGACAVVEHRRMPMRCRAARSICSTDCFSARAMSTRSPA